MSKLEIDEDCVERAIDGTKEICVAIIRQLKSNDEFQKQMGFNAASAMFKFYDMLQDIFSPYVKTGMDIINNESVNYPKFDNVKPHPIYLWDEGVENEPKCNHKMPDELKRILREILEDE